MKSALIHGVLLAVMLVYGYRTWTRDKSVKPDYGNIVLWDKAEADLKSIEFKTEKKTVLLERKGDGGNAYWWGTETSIEKKPKPKPPEPKKDEPAPAGSGSGSGSAAGSGSNAAGSGSAAKPAAGSGSGSGSAGSGSGSGSAAGSGSGSGSAAKTPPAPVEMVETTKKREFPLGDGGDKIIKGYTEARAQRDLGVPAADKLVDYKLATKEQLDARIAELKKEIDEIKLPLPEENKDKKTKPDKSAENKRNELQKKVKDAEDQKRQLETTGRPQLTISFKDGSNRTFLVGGSVYGGGDRYVMDKASGNAYVLSKDIVAGLEIGESGLQLTDPRGFDVTKIEGVEIDWAGRKMSAIRSVGGVEEKQVKTWADAATKKPNQPLATFIDNINNLKPSEYAPTMAIETMQPVVKLTYKDAAGATLGTLTLYKVEKPGVLPEGQDLDPANPPKGETQYYVVTERTRVPGLVRKDPAQRSENDLPIVFGDKPAPPPPPTGDPFKNVPIPPSHGGAPPHGDPHGAPMGGGSPFGGGGSAAPAEAGSPLAPKPPAAGSAAGSAAPKPPAPATGSAAAPKPASGSAR